MFTLIPSSRSFRSSHLTNSDTRSFNQSFTIPILAIKLIGSHTDTLAHPFRFGVPELGRVDSVEWFFGYLERTFGVQDWETTDDGDGGSEEDTSGRGGYGACSGALEGETEEVG